MKAVRGDFAAKPEVCRHRGCPSLRLFSLHSPIHGRTVPAWRKIWEAVRGPDGKDGLSLAARYSSTISPTYATDSDGCDIDEPARREGARKRGGKEGTCLTAECKVTTWTSSTRIGNTAPAAVRAEHERSITDGRRPVLPRPTDVVDTEMPWVRFRSGCAPADL